jgi:hypothetical protein
MKYFNFTKYEKPKIQIPPTLSGNERGVQKLYYEFPIVKFKPCSATIK